MFPLTELSNVVSEKTGDENSVGMTKFYRTACFRQIGGFVLALLDAIEATGYIGMTEPAAGALARFRAFNFDRIYLRPAARAQAERVVALLRGLVDFFADAPSRIPGDAADAHPEIRPGSPDAARVAVHYVSGMTDRYALGLGVELLGWRPEHLPRGV